jgi:hypothetical protein
LIGVPELNLSELDDLRDKPGFWRAAMMKEYTARVLPTLALAQ